MELEGELQMARDCGVLSLLDWQRLTRETIEIRRMLWGLRNRVLEDPDCRKRPDRRRRVRRNRKADGITGPTDKTDQTNN